MVASSSLVNVTSLFITTLSKAKMAEQRTKGLCYNWDEQYAFEHQCKEFILVRSRGLDDVVQDQGDSRATEILLHALTYKQRRL